MASTTRKAAPGRGASKTPKAKTTQAKAGAGPAIAERSKDAKPSFGKAAPKKVNPTTIKAAARPPSKPAQGKVAASKIAGGSTDTLGTKMARGAKAAVNVAAGAVVVAAKGAASLASSVTGSKDRSKSK